MKTALNQNLVFKSLSIDVKPVLEGGKLIFQPNPTGAPYIVFDSHRDAPVGFGVKVAATKKTYIIQRKVQGKVIKAKVGNVSDFTIDSARDAARKMLEIMKETKRNPNVIARELSASDITLGECFERYRAHLISRPQPAKPNTLKVLDKAKNKLEKWHGTRVKDLTSAMILARFDEIAQSTRTTAEQTFRWASVAVERLIEVESIDANNANRPPMLTFNPFAILHVEKRYRTRQQLDDSYEERGVRKPLSIESLPLFLGALWTRRGENMTGCDYLLVSLLWGARKNEPASLVWRDMLSESEAKKTSHVCLESRIAFFYDTKNRSNLTLPICDAAYEVLSRRHEDREKVHESKRKWVFPARSKFSKTGHYSDAKSLIEYICEDAGIRRIASHDLRRTFASVADDLVSNSMLKRLINHKDRSDVTEGYVTKEFERVKEALQRIELHMLETAPIVYNALLVPKYQKLPI